jgi:hypothetical protein
MCSFWSQHGDREMKRVFDAATTWADIQKEASEAIEKHKHEGHWWKQQHKITRMYEWVACRIEFLFELLPDDMAVVLKGGLKLIYNVS